MKQRPVVWSTLSQFREKPSQPHEKPTEPTLKSTWKRDLSTISHRPSMIIDCANFNPKRQKRNNYMFFSSSTKNNNRFRAHQKNPGKKCNLLPRSVVLKPRTQISSTSALHASCSSLAPGPSPENTAAAAAAASEGEGARVGANVCGIWRGLILTNNKGHKKKLTCNKYIS